MYMSSLAPKGSASAENSAAEHCCGGYKALICAVNQEPESDWDCVSQKWQQKSIAPLLKREPHFYFTFSRYIKVLLLFV